MLNAIKRAWSKGGEDNIGLLAAGISYYAFLAMVPLLGVAVLLYGLIVDAETLGQHILTITRNLPGAAADLIKDQLASVVETQGTAKGLGLLAALALALFGARNGAGGIITGLNIVFHADRSRSFLRFNLLAMGVTIAAVVGLGIVAAAIAVSSFLSGFAGSVFSYLVVAAAGLGGAAAIYRIGPNKPPPGWPAALRGAALFALGWLVATAAFGYYVANFGSYNATYGSLGAVVILLTWLYLSAFLVLLGAELAAILEGRQPQSIA